MGSGLHLINKVSSTAATDVVDGCLLGAQAFLLLEFLVEAKDGAFRLLHVASTATTGSVEGVAGWGRQLGAGSRARSSGTRSDLGGLDAHSIASAAAAGVHVSTGGWVRLVDVEVDHFDCLVCGCLYEVVCSVMQWEQSQVATIDGKVWGSVDVKWLREDL